MSQSYTLEEKYKLIKESILSPDEKDPIMLLKRVMHKDFISIHGPEHHFLDGAVFMVALKNNGLDFDLEASLDELKNRSIKMPGAMCGYWGICGSVASIGAVFSIIDKTGPLSDTLDYAKHMEFTSKVVETMSKIGGPRCCKRNAFISISEGVKFANENYGLNIKLAENTCPFSLLNQQCIGQKCPFSPLNKN